VLASTVSAANPAKGISISGTSCAPLTDGTIQCWGYNGSGNLGDGSTLNSLTAVTPYNNITNNPATQVSVGLYTTCAVFHDGTAECWGNDGGNPAAPLLGNGTTTFSLSIVAVTGIDAAHPATAIAVGNAATCVLMADTTVQCWGSNSHGELGTGASGPQTCNLQWCSTVPVPVPGLSGVTMVSVGGLADVVCAVKNDGSVWCWGSNSFSQLGNGSTASYVTSPVQIGGITTAAAVSVGYSSVCALLKDGTVQCWGNNTDGQMGNGTAGNAQTSPVTVSNITPANPATAISVNENSACALLQDGTVQCWGYAFSGSLGSGESGANELVPVPVIDL
jgi:alpha-tubulin suppressor-like RCC1 family protein